MRSVTSLLAFAAGAYAQSYAYTDPASGITFQAYQDADTSFQYGMVLPETVGTDFIGQIVMPTNGTGYGGISLTSEMVGSMLIVAWPNSGSVVASLRETSGYTSPSVYSNDSISLASISNGTYVNSTHMSYTFLCSGCIGNTETFDASTTNLIVGWAYGTNTVSNAASSSGASFQYHDAGYGDFDLDLSSATSADYSTYASMATVSNSTDSTSSSTCSTTGSNVTATVSNTTYDYIVAGGGPAGIIAAERIAEAGKSVLLIERGEASTYSSGGRATVDWNDTVTQYDVPGMSYYLTTSSIDTSEYCSDTADMAGCLLGGGTMVNALMFVRPQEADFDDKWPTGWKWSDVSDAAERLYERNPGTTMASMDHKRYDQSAWDVLETFFNKSLGYSQVDAIEQPNAKTAVYSYPPWDIQDGLRAGPVKSYLPLAKTHSNFHMSLNTKVIRAVRTNTTISGIEVELSSGARQIINLNEGGSVILAAGSMSTPRILFNSGIGPSEQIQTVESGCTSVNLPSEDQWIDLPVGENLKDHPIFELTFNTTMISSNNTMFSTQFTDPSTTNIDMFAQGSGPLAQSGQRFIFWTSMETSNGTQYFQGTCRSTDAGTVTIKLYLTHGLTSTGVLGIDAQGSTTYVTKPWMNTAADQDNMATMIDKLLDAARNSSVISYSGSATGASIVAAADYTQGDHFVGTAIMGTSNDGTSVVDTDTKVWGTDNLYVVDASIHPDLPTGNIQAPVMIVAEKAVEKILAGGSADVATGESEGEGEDDDDYCEF